MLLTIRFEDKFLSQRRRGLEKFINKVVAHQVMHDAEPVTLFLKQDDKVGACCDLFMAGLHEH